MEDILEGLNQTAGVQACMIVGKDGLLIAQSGEVPNLDTDLVAASSSEVYTAAEAITNERFEQGPVEVMHVETNHGKFVMASINDVSFLLAVARPKVNLGLVRWEVKAAAEKLKEVL